MSALPRGPDTAILGLISPDLLRVAGRHPISRGSRRVNDEQSQCGGRVDERCERWLSDCLRDYARIPTGRPLELITPPGLRLVDA